MRGARHLARLALLYVSNGNIPSRWAHTVQTLKMSEALATLAPSFRLLIATSLAEQLRPRVDLWSWYGVAVPFPVQRLPLWAWRRDPLFERAHEPRFTRIAGPWAALLRPRLVWTRSHDAALGCLRRGLPVLFEAHSPPTPRWRRKFERICTDPHLRGLVTNSQALLGVYRDAGLAPAASAAFANASDPRLLAISRADGSAARAALGIAADSKVALYVGSLAKEKGLDTLLGAAALLPSVRFFVLGGSPAQVDSWRSVTPGAANVDFRGFVAGAALPTWFAAADVGLVPNSADDERAGCTSPLKAHEYLAAGLPVVAAAIPAVSPWLHDGDSAFLHRPDDPGDLAGAIQRALANPAAALAGAARARAEARRFTWHDRARLILERFAPELLR